MDRSKWEYKKLGEISFYPRKRLEKEFLSVGNYVGVENLLKDKKGRIDAEDLPANNASTIEYMPNDILIGNIRPYLRKIWLADKNGGASGDVIVVRINEDYREFLFPNYLYLVLSDNSFFDYNMAHSKGAKMPRGDKDAVLKYTIPIPSYEDQQRIVAELDCLNEMIAVKQEQLKEFDKLAQSIFYDMFGDVSLSIQELNSLYEFIDYRGKTPNKISTGVPLITARNIRFGYLDYSVPEFISFEEFETRKTRGVAHKGDILFTTEAPMGFVAIADKDVFSTGQRVITLQRKDKVQIHNVYMLYYLMSEEFQRILLNNATGVTVKGIKAAKLKKIKVGVPPLSLQQQFAEKISAIEAQKELVKQSIAETQALLDYTMDKYFG